MSTSARAEWRTQCSNGDTYNGEVAGGTTIRDGTGEYRWAATGATYKGFWANGVPNGEGSLTMPGADGFEYVGSFEEGKRAGHGVCRFTNGRVYAGSWRNDQMSGIGSLQGAPGLDDFIEYNGHFTMGVRGGGDGGRCRYVNGDVYQGGWANGLRHGTGELVIQAQSTTRGSSPTPSFASTSVLPTDRNMASARDVCCYRGPFRQDIPCTTSSETAAEMMYADGSRYSGGVDSLRRSGRGEYLFAHGDVFRGVFREDRCEGPGHLSCADGRQYDGVWQRGQLHGRVCMTWDSFRQTGTTAATDTIVRYDGPCAANEFTGVSARVEYADGSSYTGEVRCGHPSGWGTLENKTNTRLPVEHFGADVRLLHYEGCLEAGVPHGQGTGALSVKAAAAAAAHVTEGVQAGVVALRLVYARDGQYSGAWARGVPEGEGVWRWRDGKDTYQGGIMRGVAHGSGVYTNDEATYNGECADGQPHGSGRADFIALDSSYDGAWREGLADGEGVFTSSSGGTYRGGWRKGRRSGHGVESSSIGATSFEYEGDFADNQRHGHGVLREVDTAGKERVYDGAFRAGIQVGRGTLTCSDGARIVGEFREGRPHGAVELTLANGVHFVGKYADGGPTGRGDIQYPNGDRYSGEVEAAGAPSSGADKTEVAQPQPHGAGTFHFVEGNSLQCTWQHNVLNGRGVYTNANGEVTPRLYTDGVLAGSAVAAAEDVFTPENEFPNTQSEAMLKEKLQSVKSPFSFVRRGTPQRKPSLNSKRAGKSELPALPLRVARVEPARQSSVETAPAGGPNKAKSPQAVSRTRAAPLESRGAPNEPTKTVGRISYRGVARNTTSRGRANNTARSSEAVSRAPFPGAVAKPVAASIGRFEASIRKIQANTSSSARAEPATTKVAGVSRQSSGAAPPSLAPAPLKGGLKKLMQTATAIRSSKEDEIHLLTEELHQLNETIWQVRFTLPSSPTASHSHPAAKRLEAMIDERRGVVDKLQILLRD